MYFLNEMNELPTNTYINSFTDISLEINTEKIKELNNTYAAFYDQFINISLLTNSSKLAIDNNLNVCVQNWRPWRFIVRKMQRQSTLSSLIFIDQRIDEYIIYINSILNLKNTLMDSFVTLMNSNYNLIITIVPKLKYLRNFYNLKGQLFTNNSRYLESLCNKLYKIEKNILTEIKFITNSI